MIPETFMHQHAATSQTWGRFLEFVERHPELATPFKGSGIQHIFPVQAWPTFVNPQRRQQIADATLGVFRLLKSIPKRIFGGDPGRIGAFYNKPATIMAHVISDPDGLDSAIARGDFIDSEGGFKCVEFNSCGNIGGMNIEFLAPAYRQQSAVFSRFVEETATHARSDRPVLALFEHFARETRRLAIARNEINIAVIVDDEAVHRQANTFSYAPVYTEALSRVDPALHGRIICCPLEEVESRGGAIYHRNVRMHAVWELGIRERCAEQFHIPFKYRRIAYFNSPLACLLGDKRNLSLLSQHADDARFTADEQAIIRRHIPWSRNVEDLESRYAGEVGPLLTLVKRYRERLVLKKGGGMGGEQVFIGRWISSDEWDDKLRIALADSDWMVQEYVEPRSLLYQQGERGMAPFHSVWGTYCYGDTFAGIYVRVAPENTPAPINSAQSAMTSLVFEAP